MLRVGVVTHGGFIDPQPPVNRATAWVKEIHSSDTNRYIVDMIDFEIHGASDAWFSIKKMYWPDGGKVTKDGILSGGEPIDASYRLNLSRPRVARHVDRSRNGRAPPGKGRNSKRICQKLEEVRCGCNDHTCFRRPGLLARYSPRVVSTYNVSLVLDLVNQKLNSKSVTVAALMR